MTDSIEDRIAAKTDLAVARDTAVSSTVGGLAFKDMGAYQRPEWQRLMLLEQMNIEGVAP